MTPEIRDSGISKTRQWCQVQRGGALWCLGRNIGRELCLKIRNLIFQYKFAFFETFQLQFVVHGDDDQRANRQVQVPVFLRQLNDPAFDRLDCLGSFHNHTYCAHLMWPL